MAAPTSGVGIFSGIDTNSLINQLLSLDAVPVQQAQAQIIQLQSQKASFLGLNSKLTALQSAANAFRTNKTFLSKTATSSDESSLTATATTAAAAGTYSFLVDRLVSSQQLLSTGFANKDSAALGATSFTFESTQARLDTDVNLSELNGGQGVARGKIVVTDSAGHASTIDLSRTVTVNEVLDAINNNGTAQVTASIQGNKLVLKDTASGSGTLHVDNAAGYTTASSLGIAGTATGTTLTGAAIYTLAGTTSLDQLNDGNGVYITSSTGEGAFNFTINVGGATPTAVHVNVGDVWKTVNGTLTKTEGAVSTVAGVVSRINDALTAAHVTNVSASIDATNGRLLITDSSGTQPLTVTDNSGTAAAELGLTAAPVNGSIQGRRLIAGLNSTLAQGLNGGSGIAGDGVLNITARDGTAFSVTIDKNASLNEIFDSISAASGTGTNGQPRVSVALDSRGTGIVVTDNTGATTSNLIITGTSGQDSAASLGIETDPAGVAAATQTSGNLQRQYISDATLVRNLNGGRGIGTGTFRITDSSGNSQLVDIGDDTQTVGDLIHEMNTRGLKIKAQINAHGDGIDVTEDNTTTPAGTGKISITDVTGSVAKSLNLAGTAAGTGADNHIDGTYERTVTFAATDTLQQVSDKINAAKVGVSSSIINDGSRTSPYRLNLSSVSTGEAGRFIVDSGAIDLGLSTIDAGNNSRVFFGSSDPARALAVTGSTNTLDTVVPGVNIDLKAASTTPVQLTVATDTQGIEDAIKAFTDAFNATVDQISQQTGYDADTNNGGPLLGDSTALNLREALYNALNGTATGITSQFNQLAQIGITVGDNGDISLNEDRFREAMTQDPQGIADMFAAYTKVDDSVIHLDNGSTVSNPNSGHSFSSLGVMGQFEEMVTHFVNTTDGVLTTRNKNIDDQIALQNSHITDINARLDSKRQVLQQQFLAMETAIGQLQSQQGALGSIQKVA